MSLKRNLALAAALALNPASAIGQRTPTAAPDAGASKSTSVTIIHASVTKHQSRVAAHKGEHSKLNEVQRPQGPVKSGTGQASGAANGGKSASKVFNKITANASGIFPIKIARFLTRADNNGAEFVVEGLIRNASLNGARPVVLIYGDENLARSFSASLSQEKGLGDVALLVLDPAAKNNKDFTVFKERAGQVAVFTRRSVQPVAKMDAEAALRTGSIANILRYAPTRPAAVMQIPAQE